MHAMSIVNNSHERNNCTQLHKHIQINVVELFEVHQRRVFLDVYVCIYLQIYFCERLSYQNEQPEAIINIKYIHISLN